jgi:hypothetical protein
VQFSDSESEESKSDDDIDNTELDHITDGEGDKNAAITERVKKRAHNREKRRLKLKSVE